MSSSLFRIDKHVLPCQHIRGYPRATANEQEDVLHLAIKQYTPLDNFSPKSGDITIIGAHANGFPKELYEPLWDEILRRTKQAGFSIRSIWIADVAHQGESGVLNEGKLGNDPSWFDHPRDLLHMVNHFQSQMLRPIIGIGHSMGGQNLVSLALIHQRLFETLILIDPVIRRFNPANYALAKSSAFRRDCWPSRAAAAEAFKKNKFYQTWDPRVLDCWIKHGLRDLPTLLYPSSSSTPSTPISTPTPPKSQGVTLTTTKHQEVFTFFRPNFPPLPSEPVSNPSSHMTSTAQPCFNRYTHPDITPTANLQSPFYRPEPIITFHQLPNLRPSVLYIFGSLSNLSAPESREDKLAMTGAGVGGSGGTKEGRVKEVVIEDAGHLIPMEKVGETAENVTQWVGGEIERWRGLEKLREQEWEGKEGVQRSIMGERYLNLLASSGPGLAKRRVPAEKL